MELSLSEEGRVTIPASMRRRLGIRIGGVVEVYERDGKIVISPKRRRASVTKLDDSSGSPPYEGGVASDAREDDGVVFTLTFTNYERKTKAQNRHPFPPAPERIP